MKKLLFALPFLVLAIAIGGAVVYVQAQAPDANDAALTAEDERKETKKTDDLEPPSDRYGNTGTAG